MTDQDELNWLREVDERFFVETVQQLSLDWQRESRPENGVAFRDEVIRRIRQKHEEDEKSGTARRNQVVIDGMTLEKSQSLGNQPPSTFHYAELEETDPNNVLGVEFNHYVQNVERLLQNGHERKFVLIKGERIIGVYDSWEQANDQGSLRFPNQPIFIHQILEHQPILRVRGLNF